MDFNPDLNHLELLRGKVTCKQLTIIDCYLGLLSCIADVDMRQIVAIIIFKQYRDKNSVKHADRWDSALLICIVAP